ncbi:MAG TPA: AAA family ATPase [Planctomycetota bacterium]|jgi:hypothetical protein|nr:AAA family ATPase [Planctomycetota bacterium]
MVKESSPFTPGVPVPFDFFVGRKAEIERLLRSAREVAQGHQRSVFLAGERGIGKSSLASFVRFLAARDEGLLGVHVLLGGVSDLGEMVRRVLERLINESRGQSWYAGITDLFGKRIREVGLFGVSLTFESPSTELDEIVRAFVPTLRKILEKVRGERRGLFLALDDVNGLADRPDFTNWLKSIVDEMAVSGEPFPVLLLLIAMEERREALIQIHPSVARIFDVVDIRTLSPEESAEFFRRTFDRAGVRVEPAALQVLVQAGGGFPALLHELGDAVFWLDKDDLVTEQDAYAGVLEAADRIGRKYVQPKVIREIHSRRYRAILLKMASAGLVTSIRRRDLAARLTDEENQVLDNFLGRMRKLGVLLPDRDGEPGSYRFANQLLEIYLWMEGQRTRAPRLETSTSPGRGK